MPRGYVFGLKAHTGVRHVQNFSLGHSTSVVFPYTFPQIDFNQFDFCVIDFIVNEDVFEKTNATRLAVKSRLRFLLHAMAGTSCIPIFMLMPAEQRRGKVFPVHQIYLDFSREFGVPVFDGYRALERLLGASDLEVTSHFRDSSHLAEWVAAPLGLELANQLDRISRSRPMSRIEMSMGHHYAYCTLAKDLDGPFDRIQRKTSLVTAEFLHSERPDDIMVPVGSAERVVGIGLNLSQTNTPIAVSSGGAGEDAWYGLDYFDEAARKFVFVVRTLEPVTCVDGAVRLAWPAAPQVQPTMVEIHGLALELPPAPMKLTHFGFSADQVHLVDALPDRAFHTLALEGKRLLNPS